MAKQTGLGDGLAVDGFNVSGDIGSLGRIGGGNSPLDVTGINKSGFERLGGRRDGAIEFMAFFNDETAVGIVGAHQVLKTLPTVDRVVTYQRGTTAGAPSASLVSKQVDYAATRGEDGSLTFAVDAQANAFGLEWGVTLANLNLGGPAASAGLDFAASSAFGLQAYMHTFLFTGTSATVTIQESADNGGGDPYANVAGGAFAAVSAIGAQRIATSNALTVERWLRVNVTGTFSVLVAGIFVVRNTIAGQVF